MSILVVMLFEWVLSEFGLELMDQILRVLEGKFKFINELCPQQLLVFLNLSYLDRGELCNFGKVVTIYNLHIIDSSVMISYYNLCEFKVSQRLIQLLLKLIHLSLTFLFSTLFLCQIPLALFKFLLHLLSGRLESLFLERYLQLVSHLLISLLKLLPQFWLQTLDFFFRRSLELLVRVTHPLIVLL